MVRRQDRQEVLMSNGFVHVELNTDDVGKAKQFYKKIFNWKLEDVKMGPGMTYTMVKPADGTGGGMQAKPMPNAPTMWLPYVLVDSVSKTIGKAKKLGAQIILEEQEVPDMGKLGIFMDPTGAALGVWEASMKAPRGRRATAKKASKKKAAKRR
jgi:predicted enzyme related to lactoylglutathione lyase